jgi:hypothetical protein
VTRRLGLGSRLRLRDRRQPLRQLDQQWSLQPASLRHHGRAAIGYSSAAEPLGTI